MRLLGIVLLLLMTILIDSTELCIVPLFRPLLALYCFEIQMWDLYSQILWSSLKPAAALMENCVMCFIALNERYVRCPSLRPIGLHLCGSLAVFILFASSDKGTHTYNKFNIWSCYIFPFFLALKNKFKTWLYFRFCRNCRRNIKFWTFKLKFRLFRHRRMMKI